MKSGGISENTVDASTLTWKSAEWAQTLLKELIERGERGGGGGEGERSNVKVPAAPHVTSR